MGATLVGAYVNMCVGIIDGADVIGTVVDGVGDEHPQARTMSPSEMISTRDLMVKDLITIR